MESTANVGGWSCYVCVTFIAPSLTASKPAPPPDVFRFRGPSIATQPTTFQCFRILRLQTRRAQPGEVSTDLRKLFFREWPSRACILASSPFLRHRTVAENARQ